MSKGRYNKLAEIYFLTEVDTKSNIKKEVQEAAATLEARKPTTEIGFRDGSLSL